MNHMNWEPEEIITGPPENILCGSFSTEKSQTVSHLESSQRVDTFSQRSGPLAKNRYCVIQRFWPFRGNKEECYVFINKWYCSFPLRLYNALKNNGSAKVMASILFCCPNSSVNVGDMAIEVEPSRQQPIVFFTLLHITAKWLSIEWRPTSK